MPKFIPFILFFLFYYAWRSLQFMLLILIVVYFIAENKQQFFKSTGKHATCSIVRVLHWYPNWSRMYLHTLEISWGFRICPWYSSTKSSLGTKAILSCLEPEFSRKNPGGKRKGRRIWDLQYCHIGTKCTSVYWKHEDSEYVHDILQQWVDQWANYEWLENVDFDA